MTTRKPSEKTLSRVFSDAKQARKILTMAHAELSVTEAGKARIGECLNPPKWYDVRLHALNAIEPGLHGVETMETTSGEYADYLNTGDMYADTLIYWRGAYRVQSVGDFVETQERNGVAFK